PTAPFVLAAFPSRPHASRGSIRSPLPSATLPSISEIPLKLALVPVLSPLPIAALPSISEFPFPRFLDCSFAVISSNGANGMGDIEHVAIGNRAGRRQRS